MITLCLSGGGFRATIFHLGVIRRLIYLDLFKEIKRINSVSGGSIAAGMVMKEYTLNGSFKTVEDFDERVIIPIIDFIQNSPKQKIYKLIPFQKSSKRFEKILDKFLYNDILFSELSNDIEWVCYAASLNSMLPWKFSQKSIGDSKIGFTVPGKNDKVSLGVSASACFPPLFKPIVYSLEGKTFKYKYVEGKKVDKINEVPPKEVFLVDGGIYDNLGSESVLHSSSAFIVSDASQVANIWYQKDPNKLLKIKRVVDIAMDQNTKLRRRLIYSRLANNKNSILIEASKELSNYVSCTNAGKPWQVTPEKMPVYQELPLDLERKIGSIRTDLNSFHDLEIQMLLWNGMVKIDASLKRWLPSKIKSEHWNDTPVLKIDDYEFDKANEILSRGKNMKIFRESHKSLHYREKFRINLSSKL